MRRTGPGEDLVAEDLEKRGYKVVARNFWAYGKEVDVVAVKGSETLVVEVKFRSNPKYPAHLSMTGKKLRHVFTAFNSLLRENPDIPAENVRVLLAEVSPEGKISYTEVDPHGW